MKRPILVEIAILFTIFTVIFLIGFFGYSKLFVEPNIYTIEFRDIDGITKGSPVRLMGINVGYVRKMRTNKRSVEVQIIITKKDMKIPNGATARVEFYGLGGSKSIELMPPEGDCSVGIVTNKTIRLNDVVHEAQGLVELIEIIEKFVKDMNGTTMQRTLYSVSQIKSDKINETMKSFGETTEEINGKFEALRHKQHDMIQKIDSANINIGRINRFIKR